jgi:RNA polymerase sigma factor (sigma-70 family)
MARRSLLRDPAALSAYLRRAVVNEVRARQRSSARQTARQLRTSRAERALGPGSPTEQVEQRHDLLALMQRLPMRQRTAILLRFWLDLSDTQIALAMDCPVGSVKSALSRGLESLRRAEAGGAERG